jgi:S-formylglutathione hydrolase FrmB
MQNRFIKYRSVGVLALIFIGICVQGATVTNLLVPSLSMKKNVPVTLILPETCQTNHARSPVLYLLHGYSDNNQTWVSHTSIKELAERYQIIVVCPDGGFSSWYFDSPVDPAFKYETFVANELVDFVDHHYPTLTNRESRAIAGLSMGGHGSLFLAIRHPDRFSVVACLSGGVDLRPFPDKWDIAKRLGDAQSYPDRWKNYSVITLAETLQPGELAISLDCGVDDFFITPNRNLHQLLLEHKVPHDYTERPGGHNWQYWANSIKYQMLFISDHIRR